MEKVFEACFSELQADMVDVCLEYVNGRADNIYIYCSYEANMITCDFFYKINGIITKKHMLNNVGVDFRYDTSIEVQKKALEILEKDFESFRDLCKKNNRDIPTEIKIIYDVKKNSLNADYSYDLKFSNDPEKTAYDVIMDWFNEVKQKN